MKKEIEIYLHTEGNKAVKLIKTFDDIALREIASNEGVEAATGAFFLEDQETELNPADTLEKIGLKPRHHIHCHRCKRIKVLVAYNTNVVQKPFAPSATGKQILRWAIKEFGVSGTNFVLVVEGTSQEIQSTDHIGAFASFPACTVKLLLTAQVVVEG